MITERKLSLLDFSFLPAFARFVLEEHLDEFVRVQIQISRDVNLSLLKVFETLPEPQFMALARSGATEFLTYLAENRAEEQIESSHRQWIADALPVVGQSQIVADDITQLSYVRKQGFLKLLPAYTSDPNELIRIISELDAFMMETEKRSTSTYINLINNKLLENEQRLREGIELYKQSQALTHIGNWRWDIAENYVRWSDEMYRVYGLEPQSESITYERFIELVHPSDRAVVTRHVQETLQTGKPFEYIHRILQSDGGLRYLQAKGEVVFNEQGSPAELIGTGQDITERQLAMLQLQEKQTFIEKLTDAAPSIIASYNINTGKYTFVNRAVEKLLGYPKELILQEGIAFFVSILHPDDLPEIRAANQRALETANTMEDGTFSDQIEEFRYRMRHQNGDYRWFQTYGTVFDRDQDGMVSHVLNITLDITEQVEAERKVAEKTLQIEQSNASLREFAYIASHDLKEPLRKISTFGDRLLEIQREYLTEEGRFFLDKMISSSNRMQAMINDVLAVSLVAADKDREIVSLQTILNDVLLTLDVQPDSVTVEGGNLPEARVNPMQFRQLFMNLIGNSLKFARRDVPLKVVIRYRLVPAAEVQLPLSVKARQFHQLWFTDNGIGFDNRFAGKIFAIFQRLHGRNDYEGTGIGLAICRRIVENHGGIIQADGQVNQGATFSFLFPVI